MPLLSILMPAYNCEKYVGQAIRSILSQTFSDFELLISDDGSIDSTRKIIDEYACHDPRVIVSHNSTNRGKVHTVNRLFKACSGTYVTVHDADDYSEVERFQDQIALLIDNPDLMMCGTSFSMRNANDQHFQNVIMPEDFNDILKNIFNASQFHGPTMVIRRTAVGHDLYRPFFNDYNEDCDLAFRLIERGRCTNLPRVLYHYRILPNSLSKTITPEKKSFYKLALQFYQQRAKHGTDDLMEGKLEKVYKSLLDLTADYTKDPSLIHRQNAAFLMHYRLFSSAIRNAWNACKADPLRFDNWRTLQYCVRKSTLRF